MAKDSFLLYTEWKNQIKRLSNEQAGILIKNLFAYKTGTDLLPMEDMTDMCFSFLQSQIDRDAEKYDEICEKRREAGRKGGQANGSKSKQMQANANFAKHYDNDNEYENEYENDNEKRKMNDECMITRRRAKANEDFDDGVWDPDELITTTDGTQIRLGDVHFGETVKVGMVSGEPGTTLLGHKVLTEEEKARMRKRAEEFSVKYGGA